MLTRFPMRSGRRLRYMLPVISVVLAIPLTLAIVFLFRGGLMAQVPEFDSGSDGRTAPWT